MPTRLETFLPYYRDNDFFLDGDERRAERWRNVREGAPTDRPDLRCELYLRSVDEEHFELHLRRLPLSESVLSHLRSRGAIIDRHGNTANVTLGLTAKDSPYLNQLADEIRATVGRSREKDYADPNWRWICPNTRETIRHLTQHLREFNRAERRARTKV